MAARPDQAGVPSTTTQKQVRWNVVVWNDPVNLMSFVVHVFRKLFGYSTEEATRLMLEVHDKGRTVVSTAPREQAELTCFRLHRYGLWATMEKE